MRKKLLAFPVLLILLTVSMSAQSIENQVISSTSGSFGTSDGSISWTVGEALIGTVDIQDKMITQGFHQPYLIDCTFDLTTKVECIGSDEFMLTIQSETEDELILENLNGQSESFTKSISAGPFSNFTDINGLVAPKNQAQCSKLINISEVDCSKDGFTILSLTGTVQENSNEIQIEALGDLNSGNLVLSRSIDGVKYELLETYLPGNVASVSSFQDENPPAGLAFYKLERISSDGSMTQAKFISLLRVQENAEVNYVVEAYPNPVVDQLSVYMKDYDQQNVIVSIFSVTGNLIYSQNVELTDRKIKLNMRGYDNNMYLLSLVTPNGKLISTQKIQKMD